MPQHDEETVEAQLRDQRLDHCMHFAYKRYSLGFWEEELLLHQQLVHDSSWKALVGIAPPLEWGFPSLLHHYSWKVTYQALLPQLNCAYKMRNSTDAQRRLDLNI